LVVVAAAATGDDVLPDVLTSAAARDDMVDARSRCGAVDTAAAVAGENRAARKRHVHAVGHPDEAGEAYDDRDPHHQPLAVQLSVAGLDGNGLAGENEDDR